MQPLLGALAWSTYVALGTLLLSCSAHAQELNGVAHEVPPTPWRSLPARPESRQPWRHGGSCHLPGRARMGVVLA